MRLQSKLLLCLLTVLVAGSPLAVAEDDGRFNSPQNILIADQFNNRVVEVDPEGNVVWQFGLGPDKVDASFADHTIIGTNDAQRVGSFTLIAGTGTPQGQPESPACAANGCADNRVILVNRKRKIVWQYGQFGVTGSGPNQLNVPVQNTWLPNAHVLITDQGNNRIIEVDLAKNIVWQFPPVGSTDPNLQLNNPNCAELLSNGHILICDENNNRAIEVNRAGQIVAHIGSDNTNVGGLGGVAFASRLKNGHTLITDSNNSRIIEFDKGLNNVWEYHTDGGSTAMARRGTGPLPTRAVRLRNGNTLISDQYDHRVIEVSHDQHIVRTWGTENVLGYDAHNVNIGSGGLNSPYDAKRNGDYTGITPPFGFDEE